MATNLPVDIDATNADDGTRPTVKTHQQHHDTVHAEVNRLSIGSPVVAVTSEAEADALPPGTLALILGAPGTGGGGGGSEVSATPVRISKGMNYPQPATANQTSITQTIATPDAGNLLFFVVAVDKHSGTITLPAGWTPLWNQPGLSVSVAAAYRIADGTETSVTVNWATGRNGGTILLTEYAAVTNTVVAQSLKPYSDLDVTAITAGPTASLSSSGLALAFAAFDSATTRGGIPTTVDNGFTWVSMVPEGGLDPGDGAPPIDIAAKVVPASDAPQVTFTMPAEGREDQGQAGIVVFGT